MTSVTRNSRRILLGIAAAAVWLAVVGTFFQTVQLAAKAPFTVFLTSEPKAVKIKVGRQYLAEGKYQRTPLKIPLAPGKHNLKISREGFITHEITVHGSSGQEIPVDHVLEQNPEKTIGTVYIDHSEQDDAMYVELGNGLADGLTPVTVESLLVGKDYYLDVYPEWPERRNAARCRVQVTTDPGGVDIELRRLRNGKVRFTGCRPLRKSKK